MPKNNLTTLTLTFLLFILLISQTASATTYTFNHSACSIEDPAVCLCDIYDSATDTCTITSDHTYYPGPLDYPYGTHIILNYTNMILNGKIIADSGPHTTYQGGTQISGYYGGTITITANSITGSGSFRADGKSGGTINIDAETIDIQSISATAIHGQGGTITINSTTLTCPSIHASFVRLFGSESATGGTITINSDTIYAGSITASGGRNLGYSSNDGGTITINATKFYSTGAINVNSGPYSSRTGITSYGGTINIKASGIIDITSSISSKGSTYLRESADGPITLETYKIRTTNGIAGGKIKIRYCKELEGTDFNNVIGSISEDIRTYDVDTCLDFRENKPTPTLLSLQGTITDPDDNPIDGAVTVTSLEKCADTTCAAKTSEDISAAANDISFTGGIVNSMVGPYDLIIGTTYMLTVKVCDLLSLCDTDIRIRFRG